MKLLISLPLSDAAQQFYGSSAPTYNKVGDAGIDLPFVFDAQPYDIQVPQTLLRLDFGTVFAMYTINHHNLVRCLIDASSEQEKLDYCHYQLTNRHNLGLIDSHFDVRSRSSIDKTPYRLCNSVGTIDKTYRGVQKEEYRWTGDALKASLDYHPHFGAGLASTAYLSAGDRLLQITAPALDDILWVRLDFTEANCLFWSEVIGNKSRGGFGSSGT
jgi:hypothetical protein